MTAPSQRFRVWTLLEEVGFLKSDQRASSTLKIYGAELFASECLGRHFCEVVLITGFFVGSRSMSQVEQEIPVEVDSRETALAYVAWALEPIADCFQDLGHPLPAWWIEGQLHRDLLPWEMEIIRLRNLPGCRIAYDWARVLIQNLRLIAGDAAKGGDVEFQFDGEVLRVRCGSELLAAPAKGNPWTERVLVPVEDMRLLPSRLSRRGVNIQVDPESLSIFGTRYRRRTPPGGTA